jgi:hypothetical protein
MLITKFKKQLKTLSKAVQKDDLFNNTEMLHVRDVVSMYL